MRHLIAVAAAALVITFAQPAIAQTSAAGVPIKKAPFHLPVFENEYITMMNIYVPPGRTTGFHTHTDDSVSVNIEDADIGDPQVMMKLVVAAAITAVTVMQLVKARDGTTEQLLTDAFDPEDQPILEALSLRLEGATQLQKNPHPKGSLSFATWVIARLGAWTGYYGKPGPKVISRGFYDFQRIKYGAELRL